MMLVLAGGLALWLLAAAIVLTVAGLWLERTCRVRRDDPDLLDEPDLIDPFD